MSVWVDLSAWTGVVRPERGVPVLAARNSSAVAGSVAALSGARWWAPVVDELAYCCAATVFGAEELGSAAPASSRCQRMIRKP
jgi:hypothetical protein